MKQSLKEQSHKCAQLLLQSKNTIVLTGAGISTNAGIPDFRGPQGLYTSSLYDAEKIFDIAYFLKDPKPFYEFAFDFIAIESTIQPTATHHALAALEGAGRIKAVITQNIDGLHQKACSQKVLDMHGNFLNSQYSLSLAQRLVLFFRLSVYSPYEVEGIGPFLCREK